MQTESIFATLLAAAAFLKQPIGEVASQSIKDAYSAVKTHLQKRFAENSVAAQALDLATDKPESLIRKSLLIEESTSFGLERDAELHSLATELAALLPASPLAPSQHVQVNGRGNRVQVAGGDIVMTAKHVSRNAITPDERHITVEQRTQIKVAVDELAARLGDSRPNFAGVHRMLQRRFQVASYLLIPRTQYEDALKFLRQQRAIHRSQLRHRNPVAYQNDFYRAIFAGARELGWDGNAVYRYATQKLALRAELRSLKTLGSVQLKSLAELIRGEVRMHRTNGVRSGRDSIE